MSQHKVTLGHYFRAPIEKVFDALADHARFGQIWPGSTTRIREGHDTPNGEGSIRQMRQGLVVFEETTITYQRPNVIEYTITKGTPLRNHHGRIELAADDSGTRMHYVIQYECLIPFLGKKIKQDLERNFYKGIAPWTEKLEAEAAAE